MPTSGRFGRRGSDAGYFAVKMEIDRSIPLCLCWIPVVDSCKIRPSKEAGLWERRGPVLEKGVQRIEIL